MIRVNNFKILVLVLILICNSSCSDDCTEIIDIPERIVTSQSDTSLIPGYSIEVPCDFDTESGIKNLKKLTNYSVAVLSFEFTPDTGNNTSRLQFDIIINNHNEYIVEGVPILTILTDDSWSSKSFSEDASNPCYVIDANSSCTLTYNKETSLDIGIINSIELASVDYYLFD